MTTKTTSPTKMTKEIKQALTRFTAHYRAKKGTSDELHEDDAEAMRLIIKLSKLDLLKEFATTGVLGWVEIKQDPASEPWDFTVKFLPQLHEYETRLGVTTITWTPPRAVYEITRRLNVELARHAAEAA